MRLLFSTIPKACPGKSVATNIQNAKNKLIPCFIFFHIVCFLPYFIFALYVPGFAMRSWTSKNLLPLYIVFFLANFGLPPLEQHLLCTKAKKIAIKLIPVYIIILLALYTTALNAGMFGVMRLNMHRAFAVLLWIGIGAAVLGDVLAWLYGSWKIRTKQEKL